MLGTGATGIAGYCCRCVPWSTELPRDIAGDEEAVAMLDPVGV